MNMNFCLPTTIITGKNCLASNGELLSRLGSRCIIVTGKSAARRSGALDDLISVLKSEGIEYALFDEIEQNPSYKSCLSAALAAKQMGAEFVVGIGGGSPLDAAKAIAVLAKASDTSPEALYSSKWDASPLPIVAVGTTAGTGSEVTPVSVITTPNGIKKSFRAPSLYPVLAFGDATYTMSLPPDFTRSTALDALAHCLESYFNRSSNDISRLFAKRGIAILIEMLEKTADCHLAPLSFEDREAIYCASLYGGLAISVTGTAFPHALGYFLSEQYGIPHGNACAVYLEEFIRHNVETAPKETELLFAELGTDAESLSALIRKNLPDIKISLTEEKIASLLPRYEDNKSLKKCYGKVDKDFAADILRCLFS